MGYNSSSAFLPSTKHKNLTRKKSYDPVTSTKKVFDDYNSTSVPLLLCPSKLPRYVEGINQRWFSPQYHFFSFGLISKEYVDYSPQIVF